MNRVFFIGDTHFGHRNIIGYNRPEFDNLEQMHEAMIERWNNVVGKNDIVFHLGDVAFGKHNLHYLAQLNGRKKLILGNHDTYDIIEYHRYFDRIFGCVEYKGCILTHVPIHPMQFFRFRLNIHGHVHHKDPVLMASDKYFNVCADHINLTPIAFDDIVAQRKDSFPNRVI